jgi:hypothetical protein
MKISILTFDLEAMKERFLFVIPSLYICQEVLMLSRLKGFERNQIVLHLK